MSTDPTALVRQHLAEHGPGPGPHVVGYSGGLDSVVLLWILSRLAGEFDLKLRAVTVDHGLRDFKREVETTAGFCRGCGIEHRLVSLATGLDERAFAAGQSLAQRAREERYQELRAVAERGTIFVAHHADDQAETVLLRMLRGTGVVGLAGMRAVRDDLRRPLLSARRCDLAALAAEHDLPVVEDPSNRDLHYLRNHLRHVVMPVLDHGGISPVTALGRTADLLGEQSQALQELLDPVFARLARERDGVWTFSDWQELSSPVRRAVVHRLLSHALGRSAERHQVLAVDRLLDRSDGTVSVEVADGWVVRRAYDVLRVSRETDPPPAPAVALDGAVTAAWGRWQVAAHQAVAPASFAAVGAHEAWFGQAVRWPLSLRGWHPGDRLEPFGMDGSRLVSDLLGEAGVERQLRPGWPVLLDGDGIIVWVPGLRRGRHAPAAAGSAAWHLTAYDSSS